MLTEIQKLQKDTASVSAIYFAKYNGIDVVVKGYMTIANQDAFRSDLEKNGDGSLANYIISNYNHSYDQAVKGVEYESKIYDVIIKTIIDEKISRNFAEFVKKETLPLNEFISLFSGVDYESLSYAEKIQYVQDLVSSVHPILKKIFFKITIEEDVLGIYLKHLRMHYTVIKRVVNGGNKILDMVNSSILQDKAMVQILFQVFHTLYLMQNLKLQHNDLHAENILVERLPEMTKLWYKVGDHYFKIKTRFLVRFYDWDQAYVDDPFFGKNKMIEADNFKRGGILNRYVKNFDYFQILCNMLIDCKDAQYHSRHVCQSDVFRQLFQPLIRKQLLTLDTDNMITGFDIGGKFTNDTMGSLECRGNNEANLRKLPELKSLLLHDVFKHFRDSNNSTTTTFMNSMHNISSLSMRNVVSQSMRSKRKTTQRILARSKKLKTRKSSTTTK